MAYRVQEGGKMKQPTDAEKQAVTEDYVKSLLHLEKLGLIQLVDKGACVRVSDKGRKIMQKFQELDEYNLAHPNKGI